MRIPLGLIIATLAIGCSKPAVEKIETESAVEVEVEEATLGDVDGRIDVTGVVAPAPNADSVIVAPEAARIAEVTKAEGDTVKAGEVLVRFDIPTAASAVSSARASVQQARARVETTHAAVTRLTGLVDRGVAAKREVEEAQRDQAEAEADLAKAESDLQAAQSLAGRATVTARFSGVVAKRWHNPGDMVEAAASDPILRVIDPDKLLVLASVPAGQLLKIVPGHIGHVVGPDGSTEQQVTVIARPAQLDKEGSVAEVRLAFTGASKFASGTPLQVSIAGEHKANVVLIPAEAIVREGSEAYVMVVKADKKAHKQVVVVGLSADEEVEIISGVAAGDQVIVDGQDDLPDGAAVTIKGEEKPEAGKPKS
jgi:RND family efflux transporter MFP subunit